MSGLLVVLAVPVAGALVWPVTTQPPAVWALLTLIYGFAFQMVFGGLLLLPFLSLMRWLLPRVRFGRRRTLAVLSVALFFVWANVWLWFVLPIAVLIGCAAGVVFQLPDSRSDPRAAP